MTRRPILAALAWICLTWTAAALTFPALTGRVVDQAGLLDAADRAELTETLASLEAKTTDQLVIVTLKSLQGTSIEDYGYQLGRRWRIGQKDKNNGALLIVAPTERKVRIEVGYGLEGTLTDALTKYIIETSILPRFKTGDFPGGIKRGTEQIIQLLTDNPEGLKRAAAQYASREVGRSNADMPLWPLLVVVVVGVGFLIFCAVGGGAFCQGLLQFLFLAMLSGGGRSSSSQESSPFSGGGGSFGGGGSSGSW